MSKTKLPILNVENRNNSNKFSIDEKIYSRWSQHIRAANDDNNTITIYQPIGEDFFSEGFTARRMSAALRSIGEKDVVVSINSPGGDFFEGATIYNLLREHKGHVTVKIPGLAASAASIIAMAGDTIQISDIGFYMIHNTWTCVCGNRNDMNQAAERSGIFDAAMADVYAARTGFDREEIVAMMDSDTWMNASTAIEKGFADELTHGDVVEDDDDDDKKTTAMARRTIEKAMAKFGYSRKDRDEIFTKAFGERDAAEKSLRDAGLDKNKLTGLLKIIKGDT